ncbi:hypothetical protein BDP27DRAFT_1320392 [Rhodocollybia butyracea]|uniref:Uncharacterized protein n=1 Tax=Rhodocollybia butyracea TaxID=206335 RepID=A0A9P5PYT2_9AGAR|nr:hypothetical protein BDP27DRAFT_1320392 [Rhodocollybia butyracea]
MISDLVILDSCDCMNEYNFMTIQRQPPFEAQHPLSLVEPLYAYRIITSYNGD